MRAVAMVLVMLLLAWLPPSAAPGDQVFRWRDAAGVVHYADHAGVAEAEPVALPPLLLIPKPAPATPRRTLRSEVGGRCRNCGRPAGRRKRADSRRD